MAISLQADSTLPQGYILVDGQRVASVSTTGGLSATLAASLVTTSALASGAVTTEKIAPGAVTAAKMAGGQTGDAPVYGCRAWVNFNGVLINNSPLNLPSTTTISVTAGNDFGFWTDNTGSYEASFIGVRYKLPALSGVTGGTLGGVDVSTLGVQFTEVISTSRLKFRFLSGQVPNSNASITGNNTASFTYQGLGIREAGNVSSVFKNDTGDYTINFTTSLPDANFSAVATANLGNNLVVVGDVGNQGQSKSISAYRIVCRYVNFPGANLPVLDPGTVSVQIFR